MIDLPAIRSRLDAAVEATMRQDGTPGLAIALTDRERLLMVGTYGFADLAARTPVRPETLFEIGSISKSFLAIILLQMAEAGAVDLRAPVTRYLPWFAVQSDYAPITLHHLLTHTAGIIAGTDFSPDARAEVWALRLTETGGPPGQRFHYSNVGYKALGLVVSAVTGTPYPRLVRDRILDPLGMADSVPAITHAVRHRLAVPYGQAADDLPRRADLPLAPATWLETESADGSIAATPADLAAYLRHFLDGGQAPAGRLLTPESFELLVRPPIPTGESDTYGYGLVASNVDGRARLAHGGGMVGHYAHLVGDLDAGLGAVAFVNGPGHPGALARDALDLLVAAQEGRPLPDFAPEAPGGNGRDPAEFAGKYHGQAGSIAVVAENDALTLVTPSGAALPLLPADEDAFAVHHPEFSRFLLRFGRDDLGPVEVWHGGDWYAAERYAGSTRYDVPDAWRAFPGHYRSHNPWATNFRVLLRKGQLWLALPGGDADGIGDEEPLLPVGDPDAALFRIGEDTASPERLRFDTVVGGEALRANLSGCDYYRFFTP